MEPLARQTWLAVVMAVMAVGLYFWRAPSASGPIATAAPSEAQIPSQLYQIGNPASMPKSAPKKPKSASPQQVQQEEGPQGQVLREAHARDETVKGKRGKLWANSRTAAGAAEVPSEAQMECTSLLELCHVCKVVDTHNQTFRVVQNNSTQTTPNIKSESQCAARCKRDEGCYGVVWNSATGYCAIYRQVSYLHSNDPQDRETKVLYCHSCAAHEVVPGAWMLRWNPKLFTSEDNLIEIATIHRGMQPNQEPFFATSNTKAIIERGKLVVPNNGSFLWDHSKHVGLSAEGWFSFRSLPFRFECSVPLGGHLRLQALQCSTIYTEDRVDCGYSGVTSQECVARGCCYDVGRPDAANCFTSFPKHHRFAYSSWQARKHLRTAAAWAGSCLNACRDTLTSDYALLNYVYACVIYSATASTLLVTGALLYRQSRQELQLAQLELAARALQLRVFDKFRAARRKILHAEAHGHVVLRQDDAQEGVECCVCCYRWVPNVIFLPCGHMSCCHLCVSSLWERRLFDGLEFLCPNCQTAVDSVVFPIPQGVKCVT